MNLNSMLIAGATALALAGCSSAPETGAKGNSIFDDADFFDRTFQIEDVAGRGVIDRSNITLTFLQNGRFSASTGCNTVFGPYKRVGAELKFGALGATKKMCAPALMNQEQAVLDVLADVSQVVRDKEGALIALTTDGRSLRGFESTQPTMQIYHCDDGSIVEVTYPTLDAARIVYNEQTFDMTIARSASGARYTGGGWEWWSKGENEAYLAPLSAGELIASQKGVSCAVLLENSR